MEQQLPPQPQAQSIVYNPPQNKEIPVGAKIISVFFYIQVTGLIIATVLFLINFISSLATTGVGTGAPIMLLISSLVFIAVTVLLFFIARGLWKGKNWTRIGAIILSIIVTVLYLLVVVFFLALLSTVLGMLGGGGVMAIIRTIITLGISTFIWAYLGFNKKVKEAFN